MRHAAVPTFCAALLLLTGVTAVAPAAAADRYEAVRRQVESTLLVKGKIVVAADGTVASWTLTPVEGIDAQMQEFLANNISRWRFEPVVIDGKPVNAEASMSIRLVAKRAEAGGFAVRIAGTWFGDADSSPASDLPAAAGRLVPPTYPDIALREGGQGTAYLVVRFGRDGKVAEAEVRRVDLTSLGNEQQMRAWRNQFTRAARQVASRWQFRPPSTGPEAAKDHWQVQVPVEFVIGDGPASSGGWRSYIPDPDVREVPAAASDKRLAGSDALPGNGVYPLKQSLTLLNGAGA